MSNDHAPLLQIERLTKIFGSATGGKGGAVALQDFSMTIATQPATITAIAGESGSGKTTLANLVLDFLTPTSGVIRYNGVSLGDLRGQARRAYRREVQAIFQDPYEVYNPFYKVDFVFESVISAFGLARSRADARRLTEEALEIVGLRPTEVLGRYPHQLSGGQRQRLMIARAFLLKPRLIVADEPVSMVDASLRAMILEIMVRLKVDFGISFLYITHDLSTTFQICDDIYVLYRGNVAEWGDVGVVIPEPKHPYTQLLVSSIPRPDPAAKWSEHLDLQLDDDTIDGTAGCTYAARCPYVMDRCRETRPPLYPTGDRHLAACFLYRNKETIT
jgi:peptide/nickel transport system ATP-binding protein